MLINYITGRHTPFAFNEDTIEDTILAADGDLIVVPGNTDYFGLDLILDITDTPVLFIPGMSYLSGKTNHPANIGWLSTLAATRKNLLVGFASKYTSAMHCVAGKKIFATTLLEYCTKGNERIGVYSFGELLASENAAIDAQLSTYDLMFSVFGESGEREFSNYGNLHQWKIQNIEI